MATESITLYFKQGNSDKTYCAAIKEAGGGYIVTFAYGRTGSTLKTGTKTASPVDYDSAKKIYDKLVKGKTSKGYTPGESGTPYTDTDARDTGVHCQLLNMIDNPEYYITNDDYWAQKKHNGRRMLVESAKGNTTAINRKGLSIGAPEAITTGIERAGQDCLVDGEAIDQTLHAFDLLSLHGTDIRAMAYSRRYKALKALELNGAIQVVETAKTTAEKRAMLKRLQAEGAEGIVFKKHAAPYTAGRPNSGGTQFKFKFYKTASVIVSSHTSNKRSVRMDVTDDEGNIFHIGKVTIPPNKDIPPARAIIEVRYLYAHRGGSLYQPTFLMVRDDIDPLDCRLSQLQYKNEGKLEPENAILLA